MAPSTFLIPSVAVTPTESMTLVIPPSNLSQPEQISALACLISTMRHRFTDQKQAVEVVYNLLQLGIPELRTSAADLHSLSVVRVSPTKAEYLTWAGLLGGEEAQVNPNLPTLPGIAMEEAMAVTKEVAVYVALASIFICLGKQASEQARTSVLDNRPDALTRRFTVAEADQVLLPGRSAGPVRENLEEVYNAFANYTELRKVVVLFFLGVQQNVKYPPIYLQVMLTNFSLMRNSGMTHVEAILEMTQMEPWVLRVPKLAPCWKRFQTDLEAFQEVDPAVRPYHRLLVDQHEFLFVSSGLRPLIAVAGALKEEVEKTFQGYAYNKEAYADLVEETLALRQGYRPTHSMSVLAAMLGVQDVELPAKAPRAERRHQGPV